MDRDPLLILQSSAPVSARVDSIGRCCVNDPLGDWLYGMVLILGVYNLLVDRLQGSGGLPH